MSKKVLIKEGKMPGKPIVKPEKPKSTPWKSGMPVGAKGPGKPIKK